MFTSSLLSRTFSSDNFSGPVKNMLKVLSARQIKKEGHVQKVQKGLALTHKKEEDQFGEWYSEVLVRSEMIKYRDIPEYKLLPWTMSIWEVMKNFFEREMEKKNIRELEEFPTDVLFFRRGWDYTAKTKDSGAVISMVFSDRIRGHHDLPLKFNVWGNDCYSDCSRPIPFIRSHDSLCQKGHTAFATKEEADKEVFEILELYRKIYEEFLAVPVVKGMKSQLEKPASGLYSTSVEAFVPNTGCGVEGATSHCLGQHFAEMFGIQYENEKGDLNLIWQNTWTYSTRTIGVMVMVHGDDKGLVLPPKVASLQVIVVPVPYKDADMQAIFDACSTTVKTLTEAGFRVEEDLSTHDSSCSKSRHYEMKGVPLRIEIGPNDIANKQVRVVRRDNSSKMDIPIGDLAEKVGDILENIQQSLFDAAKEKRDACIKVAKTWEEFKTALHEKKMILAPWCDEVAVEEMVKAKTKEEVYVACKTLCTPFSQPELPEGTLCFATGGPAKVWSYWGRSY